MKILLTTFSFLLSFAMVSPIAQGEKVVNLVSLEFPPLEYNSKGKGPEGIAVDLVSQIFNELGYKVNISIHPWEKSLSMVKEGKADGIFTIYWTKERAKFLDYSRNILVQQPIALYTKKGSKLNFTGDFAPLKGKRFGTVKAVNYGFTFDEAKKKYGLKTIASKSLDRSFKKLAKGQIDFVVSSFFPAHNTIKKLGISKQIKLIDYPVEVTPSYIGFSKKRELDPLKKKFDRALAKYRKKRRHLELLKKYDLSLPPEFLKNYKPHKRQAVR